MSKKSLLVVLVVLAGALTLSVIGQEEPAQPLPIVQAKVSSFGLIDPSLDFEWPTLAEAARRHDYVSFNAVYLEAKARGESVAEYDALYELWTWSMNDPIGSFYGRDIHEKLARAYPGFANYIAEFAIVDQRGNTFYPTSETRAFLLERAIAGTPSPRLTITETRTASVAAPAPEAKPITPRATAPAPRTAARTEARVVTPAPPVAKAPAVVEAPPAIVETPAVATPAPAPAPVVAESPIVVKAEEPQPAEAQPIVPEPASTLPNRGILLIVIGLIGIGLLALILRTPSEPMATTILAPPAAAEKPPAPVEPIRRTPAPGSVKAEEKPRATGSHG